MQAYNIKCIEYPNGSVQLRIYDKPMKSSEPTNYYENDAEQCVCPFTGCLVKVQNEFVEPKVLTDEERENNRYRNANRTKQWYSSTHGAPFGNGSSRLHFPVKRLIDIIMTTAARL